MHNRTSTRKGDAVKEWLQKGTALVSRFLATKPSTHASSMSYYSFLSLIPVLAISISLVSLIGISRQDVTAFFGALVPNAVNDLATTLVNEAYAQSATAFSLSSLTLLYSASKGVRALRTGLNAVYGRSETRSFVRVCIISIFAVIVLGVLFAAMTYLVFSGSVIHTLAMSFPGLKEHDSFMTSMDLLATLGIGVLSLTAFYTFLPAGTRRFVAQLPGAAIAGLAFIALSFGFRVYVEHFSNFTVIYGSIATVALLLFWMYLIYYVMLAGAYINCCLAERALRNSSVRTTR